MWCGVGVGVVWCGVGGVGWDRVDSVWGGVGVRWGGAGRGASARRFRPSLRSPQLDSTSYTMSYLPPVSPWSAARARHAAMLRPPSVCAPLPESATKKRGGYEGFQPPFLRMASMCVCSIHLHYPSEVAVCPTRLQYPSALPICSSRLPYPSALPVCTTHLPHLSALPIFPTVGW